MARDNHGAILRSIDRVFNYGSSTGSAEAQLLRQFATSGDESSFEALVTRHGPMVLGVCRRLLFDPRDVEDAFQATFLVLLRRAGSLRDADPLSPWLHGVAYKVAARIRTRSARRPAEERKAARLEAVETRSDVERHELRGILDEEIGRLPEKYRRPVVLCYLEGHTHEQAASRLRCTEGAVRGRLDRARERLKNRLTRRGVAPSAGLIAASLSADMASASVPPSWIAATVATLGRAATARAVVTTVSAVARELADGVFRAMILAKLRTAASFTAAAAVILAVSMVVLLGRSDSHARDPESAADTKPADATDVTGRVLDRDGRPIAGARVARGSDRDKALFAVTTTDAQGRFTFEDVPAGELVLTVQAGGHAPDLKTLTIGRGQRPVEFRLSAGQTIRGRMIDVHGKPFVGAPVAAYEWRGHHSLRWSTETDADGRFRWDEAPADQVLIDVGALGYHPHKRYWQMVASPEEKSITMRRALHIRGGVVDVETGRAIKPFTLIPGYAWGDGSPPTWEYDQAQQVAGSSYGITLSTIYPLRVLRVEAEGYEPGVSRGFNDDEDTVPFMFKLRRGAWVEGVVHGLDSSPLAGADVALVLPSQNTFIRNGQPPDGKDHRVIKTGPDGRFKLPAQEPPYTLLVLHDRGFAERTIAAKASPPFDLAIQPWGRIEGKLRIGKHPGTGEQISLDYDRPGDWAPKAIPWWTGETRTDDSGQFALERVLPGTVTLSRVIQVKNTPSVWTSYRTASTRTVIAPQGTARATLGGTGRSIIGKLTAPAEFAGRVDWVQINRALVAKPTQAEQLYEGLVEARNGQRARRSYAAVIGKDGSFRIDDVESGTYELIFVIDEPPANADAPPTHKPIASDRREVTVPAIPGGRTDEPLDLGTIPLVPIEQR
jgi:RNA polymerase sigma factor (sigma-70 family)